MSIGLNLSATNSQVGIQVNYVNQRTGLAFLKQNIALIGMQNYSLTGVKKQILSAEDAGNEYGFGSQLHLMAKKLYENNPSADVYCFPLSIASAGAQAEGAIEITGTASKNQILEIFIAGQLVQVPVLKSETNLEILAKIKTAIDGNLFLPITSATPVTNSTILTAKYEGSQGNNIKIKILNIDSALTINITALTGGAGVENLQNVIDDLGDLWFTQIVPGVDLTISNLDILEAEGERRWLANNATPFVAFWGSNATYTSDTAITNLRKEDRVNSVLNVQGSESLPAEIAAAHAANVANVAGNQPERHYHGLDLVGILFGGTPLTYSQRQNATDNGLATAFEEDKKYKIQDSILCYNKTGEIPPGYKYVVDINKLMVLIYNIRLLYNREQFKRAAIVTNDAVTTGHAVSPNDIKLAIIGVLEALVLQGVLTNIEAMISSFDVRINSQNPNRIDASFAPILSGSLRVINNILNFSFNFEG